MSSQNLDALVADALRDGSTPKLAGALQALKRAIRADRASGRPVPHRRLQQLWEVAEAALDKARALAATHGVDLEAESAELERARVAVDCAAPDADGRV